MLKNKKILITAVSTHYNEEDFIIQNHYDLKKRKEDKKFVSIIIIMIHTIKK